MKSRRSSSRTVYFKSLLFLGSLGLAVGGAEGLLRLLELSKTPFRIPDADRHHALLPMTETIEYWGSAHVAHASNSLGMRDFTARKVETVSDWRRILFLGDSFTEGLGVPYEQTVPAVVQGRLNVSAAEPTTECLNGGVSSYSPILELRLLHRLWAAGVDMDEVVLLIDPADVQDELLYRQALSLPIDSAAAVEDLEHKPFYSDMQIGVYQASALARRIWRTSRHFEPKWIWRDSRKEDRERWGTDPELISRWGNQGIDRLLESVAQIENETRVRGIDLHIVVYPWPYQIQGSAETDVLEERVAAFCALRGIPLISLYPAFRAATDRDRLFIPGDVHWTEAGNELVATAIADHLRKNRAKEPLANSINDRTNAGKIHRSLRMQSN